LNVILSLRNFIGNAVIITLAAAALITLTEIILYKIKARNERDHGTEKRGKETEDRRNCL